MTHAVLISPNRPRMKQLLSGPSMCLCYLRISGSGSFRLRLFPMSTSLSICELVKLTTTYLPARENCAWYAFANSRLFRITVGWSATTQGRRVVARKKLIKQKQIASRGELRHLPTRPSYLRPAFENFSHWHQARQDSRARLVTA
jgi:hypothetical protein